MHMGRKVVLWGRGEYRVLGNSVGLKTHFLSSLGCLSSSVGGNLDF